MKRKALEKKLRQAGCYLKREGASHTKSVSYRLLKKLSPKRFLKDFLKDTATHKLLTSP